MRVGIVSYWFNRGQAVVSRRIRAALDAAGLETFVLARPTKERSTAFLRSPWLCNRRDRVPCPLLETPVELWNLKNRSYLAAATEAPERGVLFCYEQVMRDPQVIATELRSRRGSGARSAAGAWRNEFTVNGRHPRRCG